MIDWMGRIGVDRWDLAVLRPGGAFIAEHSRWLSVDAVERHLGWLRAENAHGAEVYVRGARGHAWPLVLLDDTRPSLAIAITRKYAALAVRTSSQGGCHVWLVTDRCLEESRRCQVQRHLQPIVGADPASVSGEHWGRLAGFRNHGRGEWVRILASSLEPAWTPPSAIPEPARARQPLDLHLVASDRDASVADFAWCCHAMRAGQRVEQIELALRAKAAQRGKRNPADYARRTVQRASERLWVAPTPSHPDEC